MIKPILDNYNDHVNNFIRFLTTQLDCQLIYDGPADIHQHICNRTLYACSVRAKKVMRDVFPVMIGSHLDLAIRHRRTYLFGDPIDDTPDAPFQEMDIARGFFIVNGFLRHVPYFYTNDPTNTHVIPRRKVRVFTYDAHDKGKQLSYYTADCKDQGDKHRGDMYVIHNDGKETREGIDSFFDHCPYPVQPEAYMTQLHREDSFDIDHLSNKIVMSPGHLFVKLFVKYLYGPLRDRNEKAIKSRTALINKSIQTGSLLHVLSRKTVYFKEGKSAGKMTDTPQESHREIGANGKVYIEKNTGCYREVSMQTYPLNPYLLYMIVRQISSKVKKNSVPALHPSYIGFLCILGCYETKNVGRTTMMVRNTAISTCDTLDPVFHQESLFWEHVSLEPCPGSKCFVVVNEACIPVTPESFGRLDLLKLKRLLGHVECIESGPFKHIRYKAGLFFKQLPDTDVWVTPRDETFWSKRLLGLDQKRDLVQRFGYDYITGYMVDLNPFFMHNSFPKNILAFNALKNAVLATDRRYALYFMDTISAYTKRLTPYHQVLLPPVEDSISEHFVLKLPHVTVAYGSFLGCTQEDCIVRNSRVDAFDCVRLYTLRVKMEGPMTFYPVRGDPDDSDLLGTLVHHGEQTLEVESLTIHVKVVRVSPQQVHLHFTKPPFRVIQYHLGREILSICVEQDHPSSTGDKLCSLHGQKGVMRVMDAMPLLDGKVTPHLIVNAYGTFRMTGGQFKEGLTWGGGKDAKTVRNSDGEDVPGASVFYADTFYVAIAYFSDEHLYSPHTCKDDKLSGQPVKGRSREGGMRLGNMELTNGMRGNGIAACFETKFFEHSDRMPVEPTIAIPKSVGLVQEDARFFKCHLSYETEPSIVEISRKRQITEVMEE